MHSITLTRNLRRIENSQSYITNELVPERTKETAGKKLELSSTSKTVSKHNKGNSQWHSVNTLINKKNSVKKRVERGECSNKLDCVYMYVKVIFVTEKWSERGLLRPKFFLSM